MWVDLESRVVLNIDDGSVAIQQVWLFDDFFSTSVIEGESCCSFRSKSKKSPKCRVLPISQSQT